MDFLSSVRCVYLYFEPAPLDSDGNYRAYLSRCETSDDNVGSCGRVTGLYFDIESGFGVYVDSGGKTKRWLFV